MFAKSDVQRIIDRCEFRMFEWGVKLVWNVHLDEQYLPPLRYGDPARRTTSKVHIDAYIQITCDKDTCARTGAEIEGWSGRKWKISPHMTETEIVNTVFKAYEAALDHELRERFLYLGQPVFDPHRSVSMLVEISQHPFAQDTRPDQLAG